MPLLLRNHSGTIFMARGVYIPFVGNRSSVFALPALTQATVNYTESKYH